MILVGKQTTLTIFRQYRLAFLGLAFFIGLVGLWSLNDGSKTSENQLKESVMHLEGATMGTYYRVSIVNTQRLDQVALQQGIEAVFNQVIDDMSNYHDHSRLSVFNRTQTTVPFQISEDTATVINESLRLGTLTHAALDITATPLIRFWGFEQVKSRLHQMPSAAQIEALKQKTGLQYLQVKHTVDGFFLQKTIPDLIVDISSIGKGFAVDKVAAFLDAKGLVHYLIEVGGEIRVRGHAASGLPWRIAIEKPLAGKASAQQLLQLTDQSVATSGNYRQFYEMEGKTISHIIDPRTGFPVHNPLASVTVIHPSCMTADGLATALTVMGAQEALSYATEHGLAVFLVSRYEDRFVEAYSPAFKQYVVKH